MKCVGFRENAYEINLATNDHYCASATRLESLRCNLANSAKAGQQLVATTNRARAGGFGVPLKVILSLGQVHAPFRCGLMRRTFRAVSHQRILTCASR